MKILLLALVAALSAQAVQGAGVWCYVCTGKSTPYCATTDAVSTSCLSGVCLTTVTQNPSGATTYSQSCYSDLGTETLAKCQTAANENSVTDQVTGVITKETCCEGSGCNSGSASSEYTAEVSGPASPTVRQSSTGGDPPGQMCYVCNSTVDPVYCGLMAMPTLTNRQWCTGTCYTAVDSAGGTVVYSRGCDTTCNVGGSVGVAASSNSTSSNTNVRSKYQACCNTNECNVEVTRAAGAIACYMCNADGDHRCEREGTEANTKNPKHRNWNGVTLEEDGFTVDCIGECFKETQKTKNPSDFNIKRGCRTASGSDKCDTNKSFSKTKVQDSDTRDYCCTTDKCNSATNMQVSLITILMAFAYKYM